MTWPSGCTSTTVGLVGCTASATATTGLRLRWSRPWVPMLCCAGMAFSTPPATAIAQSAVQPPGQSPASERAGRPAPPHASATRVTDEAFAADAARVSLYGIAGGRLAMTRGNNEQVQSFARTLVDDHARVYGQLVEVAREMGIALPGTVSPAQETALGRLAGLTGPSFDRIFVQTIGVDAHERSVAQFRNAAMAARSASLRDFAMRTLPMLNEHLARAQTLALATQKIAVP